MKNRILKELHEIRTNAEHLAETISTDESSPFYRQKLIELSNRTVSGFSVGGNVSILTIKFGKFNWLFLSLFILFFGLALAIAIAVGNIEKPLIFLFPIVVLAYTILHAKFWSLTNKITIDCKNKVLIIASDHWLGRYLRTKSLIQFCDIQAFNKKLKTDRTNGMSYGRYRISLKTEHKEYFLFVIPHGPLYYVNEHIMIESIKGMIKNANN